MTPEDVRERVEALRKDVEEGGHGNNEEYHLTEDWIYVQTLAGIEHGHATDPAACAAEALKARGIEYDRWYA